MDTYRVQRRDMEKKAKRLRREGYVTGNLFGKEIERPCFQFVDDLAECRTVFRCKIAHILHQCGNLTCLIVEVLFPELIHFFGIGNGSGSNARSDALVINDTQMIQQTNTSPIVYSNSYSAGEINISYSTPGGGSVTNLKPSRVYLGVPQHSLTINAADGISFAVVGGTSIYLNNYGITAVPVQGSSASIDWMTLINKVNAL